MFTYDPMLDQDLIRKNLDDMSATEPVKETQIHQPAKGNRFDGLEEEFNSQKVTGNRFAGLKNEFRASIGESVKRERTQVDNEEGFAKWYADIARVTGLNPDPDAPEHKYDYRGAYEARQLPTIDLQTGEYHWPSKFKDDDHPNRYVDGVDTKYPDPVIRNYVEAEKEGLYEGLIKPTAKSLVKVPTSIAGSMALLPGAGIRSLIDLFPSINPDPSGPFIRGGSLERAMDTYNQIMGVPASLLTTPEDVKAANNIMVVMKPIEMAGEGWGLIGREVDKGLQELGLAPTYLEPLLATYGEGAAIFAAPEIVKGVKNSQRFRMLNVRERGLVVQSLAEMKAKNPQMTEGQILREFNNPTWMAEALESRSITESYAKVKQTAENVTMATVESVAKNKVNNPPKPKPEPSVQPVDHVPDYTFKSKKGNVYNKLGDKWFNSKGREVTNPYVIKAAEKSKVRFEDTFEEIVKDDDATDQLKVDIENYYKKDIDKITDQEIEDYILKESMGEKEVVDVTPEEVSEEINGDEIKLDEEGLKEVKEVKEKAIGKKVIRKRGKDKVKKVEPKVNSKIEPAEKLTTHDDLYDEIVEPKQERFPDEYFNRVRNQESTKRAIESNIEKFKDILDVELSEDQVYEVMKEMVQIGKERGDAILIKETDANVMPEQFIKRAYDNIADKISGLTTKQESPFRQPDPEITKSRLENMRPYQQIDNVDSLIGRMEAEVNGYLDGLDIDIKETKKLIGQLAENSKYWAEGSETPPAFFAQMSTAERMNFAGHMKELDDWASGINIKSASGTKLYDIGGATAEAFKSIYDKITKRDKIKILPRPPKPFIREAAKELIVGRRGNLNAATYDTNKFVNSVEQRTSKAQREVIPFVIEGTEIPNELGRPDLQKVIAKDRKSLEPIAEEIKDHFETGFKRVKKHLKDLTTKQIRDYVTHLWDIPKNKQVEAINWFSTQDKFMERRFIDTYKEGIEKGYVPKTLDISEIIKIHDAVGNRSIENVKFINAFMELRSEGVPLITRSEAPLNWPIVNYPALERRVPLSKTQIKRKGEFTKRNPVFVHPDLVRPLKVIFEQRIDGPVINAYEALNSVMKKAILSINLFHHTELAKVAIAEMGLAKTASVYFDPVKIYRSLVKGDYEVFRKSEIARDGVQHTLQLGPSSDIPIDRIQKALNNLASKTTDKVMLGRITKLSSELNSVWDKALWNYLHDTLKLYAYESSVAKLDPNMSPDLMRKSKIEIAQRINDQFGGQNWDVVGLTPREVQAMTWSLLSADWTASTIRQGLAPTGLGAIYKDTKVLRAKGGARFWLRAALYFGIGLNLMNMFFRDQDMDENPQYYRDKSEYDNLDKTMYWGNTIGNKNRLFVGRYDDGSERYVRWDKQIEDSLGLLYLPLEKKIQKLGGKVAPVPQGLVEIFTGHSLSGFKNDDIYGKKGFDSAKGIVKRVGENFLPLTLRKTLRDNTEFHLTDIFTQSSKGLSRYTAVEGFKEAIIRYNEAANAYDEDGKDDAIELFTDVYVGALRNNLPAFTLFNASLSWVEAESSKELNKDIKLIEEARAALDMSTNAFDQKRFGSRLAQLEKEKADKQAGIMLMRSALMIMKTKSEISQTGDVPPPPRK